MGGGQTAEPRSRAAVDLGLDGGLRGGRDDLELVRRLPSAQQAADLDRLTAGIDRTLVGRHRPELKLAAQLRATEEIPLGRRPGTEHTDAPTRWGRGVDQS